MTIKLDSLARYISLPEGKMISFKGNDDPRKVRVTVNCRQETVFDIHFEKTGETHLLAAVPAGLSVIEFNAPGNFAIFSDNEEHGEIRYFTSEHEPTYFKNLDPVIFTKIIQRRKRNTDLELMMFKAAQNAAAREAAMQREFTAQLDAVKASIASPAPAPAPAPAAKKGKANVPSGKTAQPVVPEIPEQDGGASVASEGDGEA